VWHAGAIARIVQAAVIGAEGEHEAAIVLGRQPGKRLALPTVQGVGAGVATDAEIVAGHVVAAPAAGSARTADPAEAGIIAGKRHSRRSSGGRLFVLPVLHLFNPRAFHQHHCLWSSVRAPQACDLVPCLQPCSALGV
jgi:hypothetical protein